MRNASTMCRIRRLFGGASDIWTPASLGSKLLVWAEADYPGNTKVSTKFDTLASRGSLSGFQQTTDANRPNVSALNGLQSAQFVTASTLFMTSLATKTQMRPLHDGTGVCVAVAVNPTTLGQQYILSNLRASTSRSGADLWINSASGDVKLEIANGTADVVNATTGAGAVAAGSTYRIIYTFQSGATPEYQLIVNEAVKASGSKSATPSAVDATYSVTLGEMAGGSWPCNAQIPAVVIATALTAGELSNLQKYLKRWG